MSLTFVVRLIIRIVASYYMIEAAVKLMTLRSDLAFWGGVALWGFLLFIWVEWGIKIYQKVKEWQNEMP